MPVEYPPPGESGAGGSTGSDGDGRGVGATSPAPRRDSLPPPGGVVSGPPQRSGPPQSNIDGLPGHIVALRPLTVGDTLDGIFQSLRHSFGRLMGIVLLIIAPYQLLSGAVLNQVAPGFGAMADPDAFEALIDDVVPILGWLAASFAVGLLVSVFVAGALTAVVSAADRGQPISVGEAMRRSLERSGATLGATILVLLGAVIVAVVLAVPLVLVALANEIVAVVLFIPVLLVVSLVALVLSYVVIPIAMEEERGAWTTFVRALSLLRRRFGYVVGLTMLVMLLLFAVTLGLSLVFLVLSLALGGANWIAESLQAILFSLISAPVTALAAWVIHRDARVRLEAYDVVVRNQALGGGA